jgi:hypothetical protein
VKEALYVIANILLLSLLGGLRVFLSSSSFLRFYIDYRARPCIPDNKEEYTLPFIGTFRIYILLFYSGRGDPQEKRLARSFLFEFG